MYFSFPLLLGLSNIIGIIVYISANAGDPGQRDSKKSYSYGWSFYFGAFSFIIAEIVGVVAVHIYIEKHQQLRAKSHSEFLKKSTFARLPPYRYRFRRRSSSRSTEPRSRDLSPISKGFHTIPSTDISMFTLSRDPSKITMGTLLNSDRDHAFLQFHNSTPKEFKESLHNNPANRRTTPVWTDLWPLPHAQHSLGGSVQRCLWGCMAWSSWWYYFLQRMKPNGLSPLPHLPLTLQVLTPPSSLTFQANPFMSFLSLCICARCFPFFLLYWKDLHILPSLEEDFTKSHGWWPGGISESPSGAFIVVPIVYPHESSGNQPPPRWPEGGIHLYVLEKHDQKSKMSEPWSS